MTAFDYTALDKQGRTRKGVLEGDTPRQIRQQLREQGLTPLVIETVIQARQQQRRQRGIRVSATDLALITRQLATLVHSGLALEETLRAVAEQTDKQRIKSLLLAVRSRVLEGHSLAEGLSDFPHVFPELFRATVSAGEQSGHLDIVLERLAEYTENRQYMRQKTLMALFYPALLTGVALLVVIGLLAYVVPQVVQVFANIKKELPFLTRALIQVSDFLREWGIVLLILLGSSIAGGRYLLRYDKFLFQYHRLLLKLPLISRIERGMNVARFTRTLSILTESGVPVLDALRITAQVVSNRQMRQAVEEVTNKVREGSSLHTALAATGLFPPMTVYLIASGEASGALEKMLERAAITQERELETLIGMLLALFEPLLILVMGGIVLVIVLAILLPIFELNQLVK
ncbi:type II secretion system inner membrane protein GspF [Beggiatoa leptomitoformis]|uniref:Type II secretion system inner membrane protein GspF n=1 Tax=Beggiatoa leptomitoformis TaxID=288004 RepID=A0A2N9YHX3_9GAMM|nr:type II secretion system inner membrane protein GspF [Beggiatoa leptomitoformis]ALG67698.1 type II secretion system inner membrane protein GspF [Beggiatoa leptomitoformis]AUI70063.1 type II secretion system inner membrane protein GspF [Beggiatoa leptomitoformis]